MNVKEEYAFRALPRRRKKEQDDSAPLFLVKLYKMISECPSYLGGWSDNGEYFLVKDPKIFAEKEIPKVYKHNNFSSFVRQLNFYGFRKIRTDQLVNSNWWEFRHQYFLRGRPELLNEIKRAVHYGTLTTNRLNP